MAGSAGLAKVRSPSFRQVETNFCRLMSVIPINIFNAPNMSQSLTFAVIHFSLDYFMGSKGIMFV